MTTPRPRVLRLDIQFLRAFAVVLVTLFHFKIVFFQVGGFLGVDIFFVISGYLMTKIVLSGLRKGVFSYIDFIAARFKRIFPAMMVFMASLCLAIFALGNWIQFHELREWMVSIHRAFFMWSNFHFATLDSYFDPGMHSNPVLHTWSLGAEWQFYLLLPIQLIVVKKMCNYFCCTKEVVFITLLTGLWFVVSFISLKYALYRSYFWFHARAWEMMMGGLTWSIEDWVRDCRLSREHQNIFKFTFLSIKSWWIRRHSFRSIHTIPPIDFEEECDDKLPTLPSSSSSLTQHHNEEDVELWSKPVQFAMLFVSAVLMGISLCVIDSTKSWPSVWAMLPISSTCLFILANTQSWPIWSFPVFNNVGNWSYSIYLYHWPLCVLFFLPSFRQPNNSTNYPFLITCITLSFVFGAVSYEVIEQRFMKIKGKWLSGCISLIVGWFLFLVVYFFTYKEKMVTLMAPLEHNAYELTELAKSGNLIDVKLNKQPPRDLMRVSVSRELLESDLFTADISVLSELSIFDIFASKQMRQMNLSLIQKCSASLSTDFPWIQAPLTSAQLPLMKPYFREDALKYLDVPEEYFNQKMFRWVEKSSLIFPATISSSSPQQLKKENERWGLNRDGTSVICDPSNDGLDYSIGAVTKCLNKHWKDGMVLVLGDSHSLAQRSLLTRLFKNLSISAMFLQIPGCRFDMGEFNPDGTEIRHSEPWAQDPYRCYHGSRDFRAFFRERKPMKIIYAGYWALYNGNFNWTRVLPMLTHYGADVLVLVDNPMFSRQSIDLTAEALLKKDMIAPFIPVKNNINTYQESIDDAEKYQLPSGTKGKLFRYYLDHASAFEIFKRSESPNTSDVAAATEKSVESEFYLRVGSLECDAPLYVDTNHIFKSEMFSSFLFSPIAIRQMLHFLGIQHKPTKPTDLTDFWLKNENRV